MTKSEYILEQSISSATCFDIEIERSLAEMNVLAEMCRCYEKAEMFAEYASDPSVVAECGIFLEADGATKSDDGSTKKNIFVKMWESAKHALSMLYEKFIEIVEKISDAPMKKMLDQIPPGTIIIQKNTDLFAVAMRAAADTLYINIIIEDFIECVRSGDVDRIKNVYAKKDAFRNYINNVIKENSESLKNSTGLMSFTKEMMIEWLDEIKKNKKLQKSRKLMKEINKLVDIKESFEKAEVSAIKSAVNNVSDYIRETTKFITHIHTECVKLSAKKQKVYDKTNYGGKVGKMRETDEDMIFPSIPSSKIGGAVPGGTGSGGEAPNYVNNNNDSLWDLDAE